MIANKKALFKFESGMNRKMNLMSWYYFEILRILRKKIINFENSTSNDFVTNTIAKGGFISNVLRNSEN